MYAALFSVRDVTYVDVKYKLSYFFPLSRLKMLLFELTGKTYKKRKNNVLLDILLPCNVHILHHFSKWKYVRLHLSAHEMSSKQTNFHS